MRIGIDLGGTKIEAVALDNDGTVRMKKRVATPQNAYVDIVEAIATLIVDVETECGERASLGLGIPGIVSPATGLVKGANSTILNGNPLDKDLTKRLGRPVRIANDANCFALSEATDGAAAGGSSDDGPDVVFGVIIGTGVGGGVVVNGQAIFGADGIAGEWGHNPLPWREGSEIPGPKCWCGHHSCIETYLSGPNLAKDHERESRQTLTAPQIAEAAAAGDPAAVATLERYEHRLARALSTIINVLNPRMIVLGGGVSNVDRLYENVPKIWTKYVFSDVVTTKLAKAKHGDSSGVRGAAWLWPAQ